MKRNRFLTSILIIGFGFYLSTNGVANSNHTGEILKKIENNPTADKSSTSGLRSEFDYLRFDVNDYSSENVDELPDNTFNYLRFDVNNFEVSDGSTIVELPVNNEFEYLMFDINKYANILNEITELPESEFDNLRFDVNLYTNDYNNNEMPITE